MAGVLLIWLPMCSVTARLGYYLVGSMLGIVLKCSMVTKKVCNHEGTPPRKQQESKRTTLLIRRATTCSDSEEQG